MAANRKNLLLKLRPLLRWVIKLRSSPKAIASGLALGTFIAFTPTYGIQIFLAVLLATVFNYNRPAALVPVWITNPVTIAPVYTFNYWIGCFVWSGPDVRIVSDILVNLSSKLAKLDFWDVQKQLVELFHIGWDILIPLTIGSIIVGVVFGALVYFCSSFLLTIFFRRRKKNRPVH